MYRAVDVAVEILRAGANHGKRFTHMQLQKLVYIAHGLSLANRNLPLIRENVNAWKFGPVIPEIYDRFKRYGAEPITLERLPESRQTSALDDESSTIISETVRIFGDLSGGQLSDMSHRSGSPWHKVWYDDCGHEIKGAVISDRLIKPHYEEIIRTGEADSL